jgi:hypothetical protein
MSKNNDIIFIDTVGVNEIFYPKPAKNFIPEWYKQTNSYTNEKKIPTLDGILPMSIKKCLPVFDAIVSGYIVTTFSDVYVSLDKDENGDQHQRYSWPQTTQVGFHPINQANLHPKQNGLSFPKWINPWGIKTPKGYSVFIKNISHSDSFFTILEGVVDTDTYNVPINFPFVMNDVNFEGLIPAGTPIAQVFPFKRENWKMQSGKTEDFKNIKALLYRTSFSNMYRNVYRKDKKYE